MASEPEITALLEKEVGPHKGTFVGAEFKLKSKESLSRKISTFANNILKGNHVKSGPAVSAEPDRKLPECQTALLKLHSEGMPVPGQPVVVDTLRYTVLLPEESYSAGALAVRASLEAKGLTHFDNKNFWVSP